MGSVQYPRIYFSGNQYWDPNTVNNNDYGSSEPYGINTWDVPHAEFDWDYLNQNDVTEPSEIPAFLAKSIPYTPPTRQLPPAEWGLYGGQQCGFVTEDEPSVDGPFSVPDQKTWTTGYTDVNGDYSTDSGVEPWLGQPLQLKTAKLVDVNPMSFWTSQILTTKLTLGTSSIGFDAKPVARMHSRFISTAPRNYNSLKDLVIAAGYGCVFQTCFDKSTVNFVGAGGPLQQQFQAAFDAGAQGMMLRYSAYATLYFQGSAFDGMDPGDRYPMLEKMGELYEDYAANGGDMPISRAYSRVAGWIGLWMPGELTTVPGGRFLIPYEQGSANGKNPISVTPSNLEASQYETQPSLPPNTDARAHAPQPLGPATVEVETDGSGNAQRITLDLSNTFPERDSTCVKADFGTATLGLRSSSGSIRWLSPNVTYDQASYETYGGLVDLPGNGITQAELLDCSFVLQVDSGQAGSTTPTLALVETLATAQSDPRGLYAEQPNPSFDDGNVANPGPGMPSTAPTVDVQVRYRGYAPQDYPGTQPSMKLTWDALSYTLDPYPSGDVPISVWHWDPILARFLPFYGAIDVPADGTVKVQVVSKGAAIPNLIFQPYTTDQGEFEGAPFMPPVGIGSSYYNVIKCLNWDNQLAVQFDDWLVLNPPNSEVTATVWALIYETYNYGFPVMNQYIANPAAFQTMATTIQSYTDPANFDKGTYMPVSRTWSAGKRHIMNSYVAYLQSGNGNADAANADAPAFQPSQPQGLLEQPGEGPPGVNLGHG